MTPSVPLWMPHLQAKAGILSMLPRKPSRAFAVRRKIPCTANISPNSQNGLDRSAWFCPHKLSDEELANFYEELKETFEALEQIEEYFSCILHDINSLILLFYLTYSFTDITEGSAAYADLYHIVCDSSAIS